MVFLVIGFLDAAAAVGFVNGVFHGLCHPVRIHDDVAVFISGGPADDLDHGCFRTEEPFLVGIKNGHQGYFRHIQPFTEQVDAYQYVKNAGPEVTDDFRSFNGGYIGMKVTHLYSCFGEEIGKVFRHFLGECGNEHTLMGLFPLMDFTEQVIHLPFNGPHFDAWIQKAGGTDNLLCQVRLYPHFIGPRRGGYINNLVDSFRKFIKGQGPVVQGAGQAEAIVHQGALSGLVAVVHGPELGHRYMGFIDHDEEIIGEIVQKGVGRLSGLSVRHMAGIVFDARAVPYLLHHFQVIVRPLFQTLGLQQFSFIPEFLQPSLQFRLNGAHSPPQFIGAGNIMGSRKYADVVSFRHRFAGEHIKLGE